MAMGATFLQEAVVSARSLRRHQKDPILLFTDQLRGRAGTRAFIPAWFIFTWILRGCLPATCSIKLAIHSTLCCWLRPSRMNRSGHGTALLRRAPSDGC